MIIKLDSNFRDINVKQKPIRSPVINKINKQNYCTSLLLMPSEYLNDESLFKAIILKAQCYYQYMHMKSTYNSYMIYNYVIEMFKIYSKKFRDLKIEHIYYTEHLITIAEELLQRRNCEDCYTNTVREDDCSFLDDFSHTITILKKINVKNDNSDEPNYKMSTTCGMLLDITYQEKLFNLMVLFTKFDGNVYDNSTIFEYMTNAYILSLSPTEHTNILSKLSKVQLNVPQFYEYNEDMILNGLRKETTHALPN